jgi:uncharacterized cupredoxin-like copper-binding protein
MKRYLLLIGACALLLSTLTACRGGALAGSIPVQITETDFHIASSVTSFVPGKSYYFEVTNNGKAMHEFMIMPGSAGSMNGMSMGSMDKSALASLGMIDPGQTQTLEYTFPTSVAGSHLEFACHFPGHYEAGMKLEVTVQA